MPQLLKGLQTDILPRNQLPGTWRDGSNYVVSQHPGSLTVEPGFSMTGISLPGYVIGSLELGDGRTVMFTLDDDGFSEIGILTSTSYTTLLRDVVLNFSRAYPIHGEYQLTIKGEDIIAFTDNYNPPRLLNLSRLGFARKADKSLLNPASFVTSQLFAPALPPTFELVDVFTGGQLSSGVYSYTVCYEDLSGFVTKWLPVSRLVSITDDPITGDYKNVDGAMPGTLTNKSVQMQILNVDTRYSFMRIACIQRLGGVITTYQFARVSISTGSITFTHSGSESKTQLTLPEVLVPGPEFKQVKLLTQLQDELFIAGLTLNKPINYQKYANNIVVNYTTKELDLKVPETSFKNPKNTFYFKPFLHDEVYALYIVFKLKSGGVSEAFHIPGRSAATLNTSWNNNGQLENTVLSGAGSTTRLVTIYEVTYMEEAVDADPNSPSTVYNYIKLFATLNSGAYPESTSTYDAVNALGQLLFAALSYDETFTAYSTKQDYLVTIVNTQIPVNAATPNYLADDSKLGNNVKYFQTRDTSNNPNANSNLSFWENENEFYPDTAQSDVWNEIGLTTTYRKQRVRHHKMPSLRSSLHYAQGSSGVVKVLGITLSQVYIPDELKLLIAGYEVYYAKRGYDNATVVGQSLLTFGSSTLQIGENSTSVTDNRQVSSTGGNWNYYMDEDATPDKWSMLKSDYIRMQPPDMLYNNARLAPTHITQQYLVAKKARIYYPEESTTKRSLLIEVNHLDNSSFFGETQTVAVKEENYLVQISDPQLVFANTNPAGKIDNSGCEHAFVAKITKGETRDFLGMLSHIPTETQLGYVNDYVRTDKEVKDKAPVDQKFFSNSPASNSGASRDLDGRVICNYLTNLNIYRTDVYNSFDSQELVSTGFVTEVNQTTSIPTYGGDAHYVNYGVRLTAPSAYTFNTVGEYGSDPNVGIKVAYHYLVESVGNFSLRHQDLTTTTSAELTNYFPKVGSEYIDEWLDTGLSKGLLIGYNSDYSAVGEYTKSYPYVVDRFIGLFPNRIHRSRITQRESQVSSWKNFPVNDYYDTARNRGSITNLATLGSRLLIHTERSLYRTLNKLQLETSSVNITLGSGDIFSIEPEELIYGKSGYAGTVLKHACLVTKLGYFFPSHTGKVFLLSDKLDEVSNKGMSLFFHELLFNQKADNPYSRAGAHAVWDELYNRILFTYLNGITDVTLSYSGDLNAWGFRHAYTPSLYTSSGDVLLSLNGNDVYLHHDGKPGVYYDVIPVASTIDVVFNEPVKSSKLLKQVNWESEVVDESGLDIYSETIDSILVYSNQQCSGELPVKHLGKLTGRMVEGTYYYNDFRDIVKDVRTVFMSNTLLDRKVIVTALNQTKAWYKRARFTSKYVIVRLSYSNTTGHRLSLHSIDAVVTQSNRL